MAAAQGLGSAAVGVWKRQRCTSSDHAAGGVAWRRLKSVARLGPKVPAGRDGHAPNCRQSTCAALNECECSGCTAVSCQAVHTAYYSKLHVCMQIHSHLRQGVQPSKQRITTKDVRDRCEVAATHQVGDSWERGVLHAPTGAGQDVTTSARQEVASAFSIWCRRLPDVSPCSSKSVLVPVAWRATPLVVGDSVLRVVRALPVSPVLRRLENPDKSCITAKTSQQTDCSLWVSPHAAPTGDLRTVLQEDNGKSAGQDVALPLVCQLQR